MGWGGELVVSTEEQQGVLATMARELEEESRGHEEAVAWRVGELCVALSPLATWCRGEVRGVEEEQVEVAFTDYGGAAWCPVTQVGWFGDSCRVTCPVTAAVLQVRRPGLHLHTPVQSLRVQVAGVAPPGGRCGDTLLNFLHGLLVEQVVQVEVATDAPLVARVTLGSTDIGHLVTSSNLSLQE